MKPEKSKPEPREKSTPAKRTKPKTGGLKKKLAERKKHHIGRKRA